MFNGSGHLLLSAPAILSSGNTITAHQVSDASSQDIFISTFGMLDFIDQTTSCGFDTDDENLKD